MNKKEINEICNYIKENPKCIIEYCDNNNWIIFKTNSHYNSCKKYILSEAQRYDYDCYDNYGSDYIPFIALIFLECAKKKIDISQIKIKSC
jgi:hydroxymethylpyrimidine pyrophosphatase-like HAD family hydrolase